MADNDPIFFDHDPPVGPTEVTLRELPVEGWNFAEAHRIKTARLPQDAVDDFESALEKAEWTRSSRSID